MKKSVLFLTLALALSLVACGTPKETTPTADDPATTTKLEKIIFTEPVRGYFWAPAYLAQTLGYFKEVGLDAEFQTVSGADASAPVFAGEAQFGLRGVEMAMISKEAGQNCKILISTSSRYPYQLVGASAEYNTIESLRGKVVAGGMGASSSPCAFAKACLTQGGLQPDADVSVISMGSAGYAAAIRGGEIQGAVATTPWSLKKLQELGGVVITDGTNEAFMKELLGSADYELFMIFTSDEYIKSNPDTVQKAVTAMTKAIQWMTTASDEDIVKNLEPLFEGKSEELLCTVQADRAGNIQNTTGYHTKDGFQAALKLTKLSGAIKQDVAEADIYDESFLKNAWTELGHI
ncbi:MAG: ABC transporter substrate-binding protein [Evtepia sp.]